MLNEGGKLYERLINNRLKKEIERTGGLADFQFGFRKGRSTVDALCRVKEIAQFANSGALQRREYCLLITVDVKNAFNSVPWRRIVRALDRKRVNPHLISVIKSYLSDRAVLVGDAGRLEVTCGVPQGSVLGPTLWNLFYDGVLRLEVPDGVVLMRYADDLAIIVQQRPRMS